MMSILKIINNDYSSVLNLIVSFLLMVITFVYAILTYKLVRATNSSVNISQKVLEHSEKQLHLSKVPLLTIKIENPRGSMCFGERERLLHVECMIKNFGDAPALDVYTRGKIMYENIDFDYEFEIDELTYLGTIATGEEKKAQLNFHTSKVEKIIEDLVISHNKNVNRGTNNLSQKPYLRPSIFIEVVYRNSFGQFFMSSQIQQTYDILAYGDKINFTTPKDTSKDKQNQVIQKHDKKRVLWGGNGELKDSETFEIELVNEIFSESSFKSISSKEGNKFVDFHKNFYK